MAHTAHHGTRTTFDAAADRSERRNAATRQNARQSARYAARSYVPGVGMLDNSEFDGE